MTGLGKRLSNIRYAALSRFEKIGCIIIVAVPILNHLKEWMGTIAVAVPLSLRIKG